MPARVFAGAVAISDPPVDASRPLLLLREANGLAADGIVLAERMARPVVVQEETLEVRVALDLDPHQVPGLALVPVGRGPYLEDGRRRLALVEPRLHPHPARAGGHREQVVVH